jgi:predicted MPP superfamily phosphohydrolase
MKLLLISLTYGLIINLTGFVICAIDKSRSKESLWRISESTLLLIGLCGGCFGLLFGMKVFRHKTRHVKFKIFIPLECALWAVAVIHLASAFTLDRQIQYLEVTYPSSKVSEALDGYTIAFITDTHALPADELRKVVTRVNEYSPDLLLLGGDFPSFDGAPERSMDILSKIQTSDGTYGVEGNHDNSYELFAAMEKFGMTPLSNSGAKVREGLFIAGVEDLWNRSPNIGKAVEDAEASDFVLLLSHNPDITMQQSTANTDLILSGHTHGGYITLFGMLAPALEWSDDITGYGRKFISGWAKSRDGADVLISNGTGYFFELPRVFARPQVLLLTLKNSE